MNQTVPVDETSRLASLLNHAALLKDRLDALASTSGERFNIFTILDREPDEMKTHSAIIADLLNPDGLHGQGEVFARLFLDRLDIKAHGDLRRARARAESDAGEHGRIDILLEMDELCIVIENKIYANDQPKQLERYHRYVNSRSMNDRVELLYLTLHGSEPDSYSLGYLRLQDIRCVSYESDIIEWLGACIKEAARIPQIRELLIQYQNLLRKLTGRHDGNLTMELASLLKKKQGDMYNFELVPPLADALRDLRIEVEWRFWESLRDRLTGRKDSRAWCLEAFPIEGALDVTKEAIESARIKGRNRDWYYGWTLCVRPCQNFLSEESFEIVLRIEHEGGSSWSWVYFGFLLVERAGERPARVTHESLQDNEFGRKFIDWTGKVNPGLKWSDRNDWFLAWRYPNQDISFLAETLVNNGFMRKLIEKPMAAVEDLAAEVEGVTEALVGPPLHTSRLSE